MNTRSATGWSAVRVRPGDAVRPPPDSKEWMKKMYPPAVSPLQSGRDVFGGHGIFEDMQPLIFVMALYGMLPVSFKPLRVSFHPLRSTLIHCVLVTALVVWSAFRLATARLELYQADTDPLETQSTFTSVVTLFHLSGLAMLPLIWLEARNFRRNETLCASLMAHFPNVRKPCRMARTVALTAAFMCLVAAPMTVGVWMTVVTTEAVHWTHVFANHHVVQLEIVVTAFNFCLFQCVKNFAMDLCSTMVQDLSLPYPSPCRVVEFRRGWLALRDLTQGLVLMPLTQLCMMIFSQLMFTLNSYLGLVCVFDQRLALGALIFFIGLQFIAMLLVICDAAQRAKDVVGKGFLQPLETFCTLRSMGEATADEISNFREIVASSPVVVSAAGFWDIDRHSLSSIMATSVGYLIVLIQFRASPESIMKTIRNSTTTVDVA